MIFYTYDEKTKEYTGTQNAFIDPLETKKQGKNVYLVPPNATDKKPLETKENQAVIFNGSEWEIIADYRNKTYYIGTEKYEMKELGDLPKGATFEPVEPEKTLDELKSDKLAELSKIADNYDQYKCPIDMYIISSTGFKVDADIRSQANMQGLVLVLPAGGTTRYKDFNNEFQTVSKEQLEVMITECKQNGLNLYQQKFTYEFLIDACDTLDEVNDIEIKFTMTDFTQKTEDDTEPEPEPEPETEDDTEPETETEQE